MNICRSGVHETECGCLYMILSSSSNEAITAGSVPGRGSVVDSDKVQAIEEELHGFDNSSPFPFAALPKVKLTKKRHQLPMPPVEPDVYRQPDRFPTQTH